MTTRLFSVILSFTILVTAEAVPTDRPANWAQPVSGTRLGNFFKVDDNVYRSKQPDTAAMAMVAKLGVKSVLNLRENHSDAEEAAGTSLQLYRVPIETSKVSDKEVIAALKILATCPKPVLVHCWHGSDRTGCIIAAYRIVFQEWSKEDAITELEEGGYGYHSQIYPEIAHYIRECDVDKIRKLIGLVESR